MKGFKYFGDDSPKLNELFKILEIVLFRAKLINSRANIQERLNKILLDFEGDIDILKEDIKKKLNESWYWGDENTKNYLDDTNMYNFGVVNYILWRYENFLQNKGYSIQNFSIENEQIEHISPKKPDNGVIENGYDIDENKNEGKFCFVMPGENMINAYLHVARTRCRTAERRQRTAGSTGT